MDDVADAVGVRADHRHAVCHPFEDADPESLESGRHQLYSDETVELLELLIGKSAVKDDIEAVAELEFFQPREQSALAYNVQTDLWRTAAHDRHRPQQVIDSFSPIESPHVEDLVRHGRSR